MIKFLTQGFARGFFRNPDVKSVELRPAKFTSAAPPPNQRHMALDKGNVRHSAPEGSKEWRLEEAAAMARAMTHAPEFRLWTDEELQQAEAARLKYGKF